MDAGWMGSRSHSVHGLVEFDVTDARRMIREYRDRTGESLSFTAFMIACLGRAVAEHPMLHAYRDWRGRLVIFDDVSVNTMFDAEVGGARTVVPHTVRSANTMSVRQIHDHIRDAQARHATFHSTARARRIALLASMPAFIRRLFFRLVFLSPWVIRKHGTVVMTSIGMFGKGGGWGIPFAGNTLCVTLGGIAEKPGVVHGEIKVREYLYVTLTVDHDIVDGAPAAAFAHRFRQLVESAAGLSEATGNQA